MTKYFYPNLKDNQKELLNIIDNIIINNTISKEEKKLFVIAKRDIERGRDFDAQHQQQGLGSRLLSWAIDDFRKQGYYRVSLSARASAHNFYLKQGFKDTREPQINHYLNLVDFEMQYIIPTRN